MEMKLKTNLMRSILSGIIEKVIKKKLGYSIPILLEDLEITTDEEGNHMIRAKVCSKITNKELTKFKEDLGL